MFYWYIWCYFVNIGWHNILRRHQTRHDIANILLKVALNTINLYRRHKYINLCHVKYCILFSECTSGTYGVNCENRCDTCVGKICEPRDGNCTSGCIEGFKGVRCNLSGILRLAPREYRTILIYTKQRSAWIVSPFLEI